MGRMRTRAAPKIENGTVSDSKLSPDAVRDAIIQQQLDKLEAQGVIWKTGETRRARDGRMVPVYTSIFWNRQPPTEPVHDHDDNELRRQLREGIEEVIEEAVLDGELVRDGHGRIMEAKEARPDFVDPNPGRPH
jgi:hypothetical protein